VLHIAAKEGHDQLVVFFLGHGWEIDMKTKVEPFSLPIAQFLSWIIAKVLSIALCLSIWSLLDR
jgi:hypothetical protein